jgi:hypothetical protein
VFVRNEKASEQKKSQKKEPTLAQPVRAEHPAVLQKQVFDEV